MGYPAIVWDASDSHGERSRARTDELPHAIYRRGTRREAGADEIFLVAKGTGTGFGAPPYVKWLGAIGKALAATGVDPFTRTAVNAGYLIGVPGTAPARVAAMMAYALARPVIKTPGIQLIYLAREELRKAALERSKTPDAVMAAFGSLATAIAGPLGGEIVAKAYSAFKSFGEALSRAPGDSDKEIQVLEATITKIMSEGYPPPLRILGWGEWASAVKLTALANAYADQFRALTNAERADVTDFWASYLYFANEATVAPYASAFPSGLSAAYPSDEQVMFVGAVYATRFKLDVRAFTESIWRLATPAEGYASQFASLAKWARAQNPIAPIPVGGSKPSGGGGGGGGVSLPLFGTPASSTSSTKSSASSGIVPLVVVAVVAAKLGGMF